MRDTDGMFLHDMTNASLLFLLHPPPSNINTQINLYQEIRFYDCFSLMWIHTEIMTKTILMNCLFILGVMVRLTLWQLKSTHRTGGPLIKTFLTVVQ